jgi:hypothetical protein
MNQFSYVQYPSGFKIFFQIKIDNKLVINLEALETWPNILTSTLEQKHTMFLICYAFPKNTLKCQTHFA